MDYSCTCRYHTLIDALPDYITVNVGDLECLRSNLHIHVVTLVLGKKEFNILFKFFDKLGGEMGLTVCAYYHLVQAQIKCCKAKYCDFVAKGEYERASGILP